jgi:hypothetical protein
MNDQELHAAHGLCYQAGTDARWWFDFGRPCVHPEWHADV